MGVENFETTIKLGTAEIKLRGTTSTGIKGFIETVAPWYDIPCVCQNCGGTDLKFTHRNVKDFTYYSVDCRNANCKWTYKFGQLKDGSGLFGKGWESPYQGNSNGGGYDQQVDPYSGQSAGYAAGGFDQNEDVDFNYGANAPGSGQPAQAVAATRPPQNQQGRPPAQAQQKQYSAEEMKARAILGMK